MLPCFVMIDLETTGGSALQDRITEIAAVRIEDGVQTQRWSTLVNPGVAIPPYIHALTGISDEMVCNAPRFDQVAADLLTLLEGAVFVAHNVPFDHGFVKAELARMGQTMDTRTLCTVRLSRRLYPQHKGHGLDAIAKRHGIHNQARHRAMGDVDTVLGFLQIARQELGADALAQAAADLVQGGSCIPAQLETPVESLPNAQGVYLMFGSGSAPLFVGKAKDIQSRVLSHFQSAAKVERERRISQNVRRIEWQLTNTVEESFALEMQLRDDLKPLYNRKLKPAPMGIHRSASRKEFAS